MASVAFSTSLSTTAFAARIACLLVLFALAAPGCRAVNSTTRSSHPTQVPPPSAFSGISAGDAREVAGIKLCWCPAGEFIMGSPPAELERRPGEDQVEVT